MCRILGQIGANTGLYRRYQANLVWRAAPVGPTAVILHPEELPRIKHIRVYSEGAHEPPPWRITCFFVDKSYQGKGVSSLALAGAPQEISRPSVTRVAQATPAINLCTKSAVVDALYLRIRRAR